MMDHASARSSVDGLFTGNARRLPELRAHLESCLECRNHYDRTARAFRALSGRPDEMTPEELSLFAPAFPDSSSRATPRWPLVWMGGLAVAATAVLVVFVNDHPEPSEFTPRGGPAVEQKSSARAVCTHEQAGALEVSDAVDGKCATGDRLAFLAGPLKGNRYIAVALVDQTDRIEVVVAGTDGAMEDGVAPLPSATRWRPGLKAVGIHGPAPISMELAEKCMQGHCPPPLQMIEIPMGKKTP